MINLESVEQLNELKKGKVVLMFSANWCGDCRFIEPFLPEIEQAQPDYTFVKVDRDEFLDVCIEYDVMGIPSFIVIDNNEVKGTFISKLRKTKEEILSFLEQVI